MTGDLPALIASVFQALRVAGQAKAEKTATAPVPAAPIRKSVVPLSMVVFGDSWVATADRVGLEGLVPTSADRS